jgi:dTDP-glucose 4,6-dehydratase
MVKPVPREDLEHILKHAHDAWESLRGARIFITGGTGFFGVWLLESFVFANEALQLQAEMLVLSRDPDSFRSKFPHLAACPHIQFWQGDVRNYTFPPGHFSHVIHAATEASAKLNKQDPIKMLDVILQGTQHTFDFAKTCSAQHILLTSSGAIYGRQAPEMIHISEESLGSPDISLPAWAYGVGKRTAEHMATLYAYQHQLNIKITRCFAFIGPHLPLDAHFAAGNFIRDALQGKTIEIAGDGTPFRSYQYAADLVVWLLKILCFGKRCVPYNVGSDEAISIAELANTVASCINPPVEVSIAKQADPRVLPERYVPSIARAKQDLALINFVDLTESIKRTIKWCHENYEV